ncbi:MAG TPA: hypothetical protein VKB34_22525 [Povalibacter sp.]|nr:hypothetical protein [Povalibacter sp.]
MQIPPDTERVFSVLLLSSDLRGAAALAAELQLAGLEVHIAGGVDSALRLLRKTFYFALLVMADLADPDTPAALQRLRGRARRTWMIVAASSCDVPVCALIHRCGGDACITLPISVDELLERFAALRARTRPSF